MASLQDLQGQVSAMNKRKAELRLESRRVSQKLRRSCQEPQHLAHMLIAAGRSQVLPSLSRISFTLVLQMLALFELSEFQTDILASFVLGQGRPSHCRNHGLDIWGDDVRSSIGLGFDVMYREVPLEVALGALDCCAGQLRLLCKFIVEYRLFHWLVEMNCSKGVAPGSPQLAAKAQLYIPVLAPVGVKLALKAVFRVGSRKMRHWVASFRERWGCKPGLLDVGEDVKPLDLERKVP